MITLADLARQVGGEISGDPSTIILRVRPFTNAEKGDLTLAVKPALIQELAKTDASAVIVPDSPENRYYCAVTRNWYSLKPWIYLCPNPLRQREFPPKPQLVRIVQFPEKFLFMNLFRLEIRQPLRTG